ncbi:MAG TPA: hypothetical protein PLM70_08765 [Bacteroidales bacterium]|nr:hypothetical protein [Bacteroidales bacterium]
MKKNSLILLAFISLAAVFTSCEPEYYKPTNPKYEVGDLITIDGVEAVVFFVSFDGEHGKAIAAKSEAALQWSTAGTIVGANSTTDGKFNQNQVQKRPIVSGDDWRLLFPSFYATFNTAPHTLPIPAETLKVVKWYMPSVEEMKLIFEQFDIINAAIPNEIGYKKLRQNIRYWTSTEVDAINAKVLTYNDGTITIESKMRTNNDAFYRAIIDF